MPFAESLRFCAVFYLIVVVFSGISEVTFYRRTICEVRKSILAVVLRAQILMPVTSPGDPSKGLNVGLQKFGPDDGG